MLNSRHHNSGMLHGHRSGFTLIEMLVSVTLVLLVLTLFSAIFGLATDTISAQRGIANNDQQARSLVTLLRHDVAKRSFRNVYPFYPTEDSGLSPTTFNNRRGYFYISTNNPISYQDDLIQFTVDAAVTDEDNDSTKFRGAAAALTAGDLSLNPNQPDADDALTTSNGVAESDLAEVSYFLRNGKLIRRIMLIREPLSFLSTSETPTLGADGSGADLIGDNPGTFNVDGVTADEDFYRYFDFSVIPRRTTAPLANLNEPTSLLFVGADSFDNSLATGALGMPQNRFGFNPMTGFSREHSDLTSRQFIGRYLHAETSSEAFNYPLGPSLIDATHNGNPMNLFGEDLNGNSTLDAGEDLDGDGLIDPGFPVTLVANTDTSRAADVVTEFNDGTRGGPRRYEDVVLTRVHEFRVEVWDNRVGRFVVPGYGSATDADADVGDYHIRRNLQFETGVGFKYGPLAANPAANPAGTVPGVFDTWHFDMVNAPEVSDFDRDGTVEMSEMQSPYVPYVFYPPKQNETSLAALPDGPPNPVDNGPSSTLAPQQTVQVEVAPLDFRAHSVAYWQSGVAYLSGDVVFAWDGTAASGWDDDGSTTFEWDTDAPAVPNQAYQIAYRCTVGGTADATPPVWPLTPGQTVTEAVGGVTWEVIDNTASLSAARITIRFEDQASGQIRQLSTILPLTNE